MTNFEHESTSWTTRVSLWDPNAYRMIPGVSPTRREIIDTFVNGFPQYVEAKASGGDLEATELLSAINQLPDDYLAQTVYLGADGVDWTDDSPISEVSPLFEALISLNNVLNLLPLERYAAMPSLDDQVFDEDRAHRSNAPLAIYTRCLFQNRELDIRHGYFWERYLQNELAGQYVADRGVEIPPALQMMYGQVATIYEKAMTQASDGVDTRGVGQILGELVKSLGKFELADPCYDYAYREFICEEIRPLLEQENLDAEAILTALLNHIKPVDIDASQIRGAVFKPVSIAGQNGEVLFEDWQRFDAFWFQSPFDDQQDQDTPEIGFPDDPQIIRSYKDGGQEDPQEQRVTIYKDPSYFRPDGSKVYWGDLSIADVAKVKGNYYCLSQWESYHCVPEWSVTFASFVDNQDPNRPYHSIINTPEGQFLLPSNPLLMDPVYLRAVAVGAIVSGRFVENKRACRIDFVLAD